MVTGSLGLRVGNSNAIALFLLWDAALDVASSIEMDISYNVRAVNGNIITRGLPHLDDASAEFILCQRSCLTAKLRWLVIHRHFYTVVFRSFLGNIPLGASFSLLQTLIFRIDTNIPAVKIFTSSMRFIPLNAFTLYINHLL